MKKKFLTGMLLGTLALSATPFVVGCSDDDDISRLEEQVAANTNAATVDKNELLALINKTSAELTEQLELATSGKADNQAVIELQKKPKIWHDYFRSLPQFHGEHLLYRQPQNPAHSLHR